MFTRKNSAQKLRDAADLINQSLAWSDTPQGSGYWAEVFRNLTELSAKANGGAGALLASQVINADDIPTEAPEASVLQKIIVHLYDKDSALCGLKGNPDQWPGGNTFVHSSDKNKVTCLFCKAKAPL